MDNLCYVKLKNRLLLLESEKELSRYIEERIKKLSNYTELKIDNEVIKLVCNIVENSDLSKNLKNNKKKFDKKQFVIKVLSSIYNYLDSDKKQVDTIIEDLHTNGDIKKIPLIKKYKLLFFEWVKKNFFNYLLVY